MSAVSQTSSRVVPLAIAVHLPRQCRLPEEHFYAKTVNTWKGRSESVLGARGMLPDRQRDRLLARLDGPADSVVIWDGDPA